MLRRVVMAKDPVPGRVKTRLTPELDPVLAAAVHQTLMLHVIDRLEADVVCFDPPPARQRFARLLGPHTALLPQSPGDLGDRLAEAFASLSKAGDAVLFFGVDSPDVPLDAVDDAANLLATHDIVLGPTEDGGFWCVGVSADVDAKALFADIRWSSGMELADVRDRAASLGLSLGLAQAWDDIDHTSDLARVMDRLRQSRVPAERMLHAQLEPLLETMGVAR